MTDFNIRITEINGDVGIYPEATSIGIVDNTIEVVWDGDHAVYSMDEVDEIVVRVNHR